MLSPARRECTHHFVGNVLEIAMHQRQQTEACQED